MNKHRAQVDILYSNSLFFSILTDQTQNTFIFISQEYFKKLKIELIKAETFNLKFFKLLELYMS